MARSPAYYAARHEVLLAALRVVSHNYDRAEDPGWQAELDDEQLDEAVVKMADAIHKSKGVGNEPG